MVPNGWEFTTFEHHIDLLSGFAFKSAQYTENSDDIRLLRGDNIAPNTLRWDGVKTWDKHQYAELQKYHLRENDFVIAMDRTWVSSGLKVAEVTKNDLPCLLVQRVARIRSLPTLEQSLLRQYFSSHRFEQYVKGVQTETAVPHISSKQIKEFPLLLPPLPEQRKIAQILSTWDCGIATTEKLIDASKQQKKALMQQLLTGKKHLVNPETGKAFEGEWEEVKLGDISYVTTGNSNREDSSLDAEYTFFDRSEDIRKSSRYLFDSEAVIVAGEGQDFIPKYFKGKFDLHQRTYAIMNFEKSVGKFLYYYIGFTRHYFLSQAVGSTVKSLRLPMFQKMPIQLPSKDEQQKIASVLTAADKDIELLEAKLAHFKQEKKALIQQLLTGKRRVKVAEAEAA
ncbi:restriction endonuclease subunit S [Vibrio cholerae]|uniref:restriction endonuclease subunit S n=1 Tax=Vibrio cholerae TaxID=666 RepID=UPI0010FED85F|nr:restriction endonuclease subunit S [Vibrio cholerae]TLE10876.1 restriction endonuclease subunit S [Vibrio cholerae]TLE17127.1 restriction endonuclease subunit S [Vibrio cholerae]